MDSGVRQSGVRHGDRGARQMSTVSVTCEIFKKSDESSEAVGAAPDCCGFALKSWRTMSSLRPRELGP